VVLVGSFTGPGASGVSLRNSVQVRIDELNGHGGLLGRRVELVAADDETNPTKAGQLVREHLADERVGLLVGPSATDTYAAARQIVEQARVPNCLPTRVADEAITGAGYTFLSRPTDRTRTSALLDYLQKHTQVRKVGLLSAGEEGDRAADQQLGALSQKYGVEYLGAALISASDARTAVQQLASRGAQGVVLPGDPTAAGQASGALQELRLQPLGFDELARVAYTNQAADAAVGTILTAPNRSYLSDIPDSRWAPAYRAFVRSVAGRYGYATNGLEITGLPEAAECVSLWARAVGRAGSFDGQSVARAWEGLRLTADQTVLGVRERFGPGQHDAVGTDGVFVYQWVQNGDQFRLKQLSP
jgi:branched-chain amino acid transport system substrate-binding protein